MKYLPHSKLLSEKQIELSGSKSISNRLLILKARFSQLEIENLGDAKDVYLLKKALNSTEETVDIHHAGTAMRFLTAYFALHTPRRRIITGSDRMKNRLIAPLVEALRSMGARINYIENEGFPPLEILPAHHLKTHVEIDGSMSSQYISALLLSGEDLEISINGKVTSRPYLEMSIKQLRQVGIQVIWEGNKIYLPKNAEIFPQTIQVESDWSSASYLYSLVGIGRQPLYVKNLYENSSQGDAQIREIAENYFGIKTYGNKNILLKPSAHWKKPKYIALDLNDIPDLAQTLCVLSAAWEIPFKFTGLHTLRIKETDRLLALQNELKKIGCQTEISNHHIASVGYTKFSVMPQIETYQDHRMALSFAPLCLKFSLKIEHPEVVEKSYPNFWNDLQKIIFVK